MDFLEELDIDFTMPTIDFTEDWADVDFNMTDEEVSKLFDLTDENFNGLFADEA